MTEIKSNMTVLCQNNHRKNSKLKKKTKKNKGLDGIQENDPKGAAERRRIISRSLNGLIILKHSGGKIN